MNNQNKQQWVNAALELVTQLSTKILDTFSEDVQKADGRVGWCGDTLDQLAVITPSLDNLIDRKATLLITEDDLKSISDFFVGYLNHPEYSSIEFTISPLTYWYSAMEIRPSLSMGILHVPPRFMKRLIEVTPSSISQSIVDIVLRIAARSQILEDAASRALTEEFEPLISSSKVDTYQSLHLLSKRWMIMDSLCVLSLADLHIIGPRGSAELAAVRVILEAIRPICLDYMYRMTYDQLSMVLDYDRRQQ